MINSRIMCVAIISGLVGVGAYAKDTKVGVHDSGSVDAVRISTQKNSQDEGEVSNIDKASYKKAKKPAESRGPATETHDTEKNKRNLDYPKEDHDRTQPGRASSLKEHDGTLPTVFDKLFQ